MFSDLIRKRGLFRKEGGNRLEQTSGEALYTKNPAGEKCWETNGSPETERIDLESV